MSPLPTSSIFVLTLTLGLWSTIRLFSWEFPHSGYNTPPMLGDFEAQRHWVEITNALPPSQWYHDGKDNNLTYWGLDYPPLSAFHAQLIGVAAKAVFESGLVDEYMGFTPSKLAATAQEEDEEEVKNEPSEKEQTRELSSGAQNTGIRVIYYDDNTPSAAWDSIFGLHVSKGVETQLVKDVMDAAVFISDILCYVIPAFLLAGQLSSMSSRAEGSIVTKCKAMKANGEKGTASSSSLSSSFSVYTSRIGLFSALVLLPVSMVNIDYGHFQFNCVTLGMLVLAVYWVAKAEERAALISSGHTFTSVFDFVAPVAAAICFFAAALFKITSLYAVPMFAFYCLAWCAFRYLSKVSDAQKKRMSGAEEKNSLKGSGRDTTSSPPSLFARVFGCISAMVPFVIAIGVVLAVTFYPFRKDVPQVLHRMFPLARGLYEDKVANIWCVVSPVFKLTSFAEKLFSASIESRVASVVEAASSLSGSSTDETGEGVAAAARHAALVGRVAFLCTIATAAGFLPVCVGIMKRVYTARSHGPRLQQQQKLQQDHIRNALMKKHEEGEEGGQIQSTVTTSAASLVSSSVSASALYAQLNPMAVALRTLFHLSLAGLVGSLSFFLYSFQVHEKSILVPCAMAVICIAVGLAAKVRPIFLVLISVFLIAAQCSLCQLAEKDNSMKLWYALWFLLNFLVFPLGQLAAEDAAGGGAKEGGGDGLWFAGSIPTMFSAIFYVFHTKICPLLLDNVYPRYPHLGVLVRMSICCGVFVSIWAFGTWTVLFAKDSFVFRDGEDDFEIVTLEGDGLAGKGVTMRAQESSTQKEALHMSSSASTESKKRATGSVTKRK